MAIKPGNQETIRIRNQNRIIEEVINKHVNSRADISKNLKLSAPAVSSNIEKLIDRNILMDVGEGESAGPTGGRKPRLISFNYKCKYIAVVDLDGKGIQVAIYYLDGVCAIRETVMLNSSKITKKDIIRVTEIIQMLMYKVNLPKENLAVISVGTPGLLDHETGYFVNAPIFDDFQNINIEHIFTDCFDCKVLVENDINLATMAEMKYGSARNFKDVLYISVGHGIGAGIVLDGKLHRGSRLAAGEIGYWLSDDEQILDYEISIYTMLKSLKKDKGDKANIQALKVGILSNDPYYKLYTEKLVNRLAKLIINTSTLLDFELVIIGGEISELGEFIIPLLQKEIEKKVIFPIVIKKSKFNGNGVEKGSVAVGSEYVLKRLV